MNYRGPEEQKLCQYRRDGKAAAPRRLLIEDWTLKKAHHSAGRSFVEPYQKKNRRGLLRTCDCGAQVLGGLQLCGAVEMEWNNGWHGIES